MKKFFKVIWITLLAFGIFAVIFASSIVYEGYTMYNEKKAEISLEDKIDSIRKKEDYIYYDDIPLDFINAIVAVEDHRFFEHNGVDIISIGRAVITDIKEMALVEGGSTITQQLAKNLYYTQDKKFSRKVAEVFTAFDLEKKYSKEDIIEIYINIVYFGDGYYGILDASNGYFSKDVKDLSLYEITLLAGLPNAPSAYALSNDKTLAIKRQNLVIDAMVEYDYLNEEEAKKLKNMQ